MAAPAKISWSRVIGTACGLTLSIAGWVAAQDRQAADRANCLSNLKHLSSGLMMYCMDYDQQHPPASRWQTVVRPYVRTMAIMQCPSDRKGPSYALNSNVSGALVRQIRSPADLVVLFESNLHRPNSSGTKAAIAAPPRHGGGNNYGFADGHCKWFVKPPDFGKPLNPPRKPAPRKPRKGR